MPFKEFLAEFYPSVTNYLDMDWPVDQSLESDLFLANMWYGFIRGDDTYYTIDKI
jgi:hypothetical protein